jgi:hypothetical protein
MQSQSRLRSYTYDANVDVAVAYHTEKAKKKKKSPQREFCLLHPKRRILVHPNELDRTGAVCSDSIVKREMFHHDLLL